MTKLTHLTLNTGHLTRTSREDVDQAVVDALLPIVDADGGPIPGIPGWYLDFMRPLNPDRSAPVNGAAFFQIADQPGRSPLPAVLAVACWKENMAPAAWKQIIQGYTALEPALRSAGIWRAPPPAHPRHTPWLVVALTPFIALADAENAKAFGDLERAVAWALAL
ncbi:hypothetical protein HLH44_20510 [Gluconacetobacter sp. 1c LMG 22058]|uniref:Uncharacterized protein n=1 Tax=Gluconacetobacter dulcium TaxID=2729096 RepID=A0A7W4PIY2_9PROT|nr:hypothetical protein [Gluconacetobacter dulcium]MBB2199777.1 hypothetical protein [Gluconacetobacter dulcium]